MTNKIRQERLREVIKADIAETLQRELKDPRIKFLTITDVTVSSDLRHVKIYFSVLGGEDKFEEAIAGLESAKGFIRSDLAGKLALRFVPEISFLPDHSLEHAARIMSLLSQLKEEKNDR
ncbi:MAG: 30S ribosome-binding factor RbfA [Bacillota bacterium]